MALILSCDEYGIEAVTLAEVAQDLSGRDVRRREQEVHQQVDGLQLLFDALCIISVRRVDSVDKNTGMEHLIPDCKIILVQLLLDPI